MFSMMQGDPNKAYASPQDQLGQPVHDKKGDLWRACKGAEDVLYGEVLRQAAAVVTGTVTTVAVVGNKTLIDSAAFASITNAQVQGGVGVTLGTLANGGGQRFTVTRRVDANTLGINCRAYNSAADVITKNSRLDGGWPIALTTSTTFAVSMLGLVQDAEESFPVYGLCQVYGGVDVSETPYFYAKLTGIGDCLGDDSDNTILIGEWVSVSASTNGYVQGPDGTGAGVVAEALSLVGVALHGEIGLDGLVVVDLKIGLGGVGDFYPRANLPLNEVTVA